MCACTHRRGDRRGSRRRMTSSRSARGSPRSGRRRCDYTSHRRGRSRHVAGGRAVRLCPRNRSWNGDMSAKRHRRSACHSRRCRMARSTGGWRPSKGHRRRGCRGSRHRVAASGASRMRSGRHLSSNGLGQRHAARLCRARWSAHGGDRRQADCFKRHQRVGRNALSGRAPSHRRSASGKRHPDGSRCRHSVAGGTCRCCGSNGRRRRRWRRGCH